MTRSRRASRKQGPDSVCMAATCALIRHIAMFKQEFFRPKELELIANVPFFLAVGNHETWGANTKAFTQAPASLGNAGLLLVRLR